MRWICVTLFLLVACEHQGGQPSSPRGGGNKAAPKAQPSAEPADNAGEEAIVPPPDKPGYAKPE